MRPLARSCGAAAKSFSGTAAELGMQVAGLRRCERIGGTTDLRPAGIARMRPPAGGAQGWMQERRGQQRDGERPAEPAGQHGVGEPECKEFGIGAVRQHGFYRVGRGEWCPPARRRVVLGRSDRAAQSVVDGQAQGFGEGENKRIGQGIGAIEFAPGQQQAATRSGIAAGGAEEKRIAEQKFVFAAAGMCGTGGGGLQRQAAAPHPGPGGGGVDASY